MIISTGNSEKLLFAGLNKIFEEVRNGAKY